MSYKVRIFRVSKIVPIFSADIEARTVVVEGMAEALDSNQVAGLQQVALDILVDNPPVDSDKLVVEALVGIADSDHTLVVAELADGIAD